MENTLHILLWGQVRGATNSQNEIKKSVSGATSLHRVSQDSSALSDKEKQRDILGIESEHQKPCVSWQEFGFHKLCASSYLNSWLTPERPVLYFPSCCRNPVLNLKEVTFAQRGLEGNHLLH